MSITSFLSLASISLGLVVPSVSLGVVGNKNFSYDDFLIVPIDTNEIAMKYSMLYSGSESYVNCSIQYELYSSMFENGKTPFAVSYGQQNFALRKNKTINFSYKINGIIPYLSKGIKVYGGVYAIGRYLVKNTYYLEKIRSEVINPDDYRISPYVNNNSCYFSGAKVSESYLFNNFSSIIEMDEYYKLDFSSISFEYDYPLGIKYENAFISIRDINNLFPYLPKDENGNPYFNVSLVQEGKVVSITLPTLYVNTESLEISATPEDGFVETNYFYLPKNGRQKMANYIFDINLINMGVNKTSVYYPIEFNAKKLVLGPCDSAEYCIVGGVIQ